MGKKAIIIGGGVAGLTAALELLRNTDIEPVIFEGSDSVGGIAKTVEYDGNLMDIGGHRYFSKSDRVMDWWMGMLPVSEEDFPEEENVMLKRNRISRIYYLKKFFDYPVTLSANTVGNLGLTRMTAIGFSYIKSIAFPIRPETSLEDFFINRFGRRLYETFFKDYTEKVWGLPCSEIGADWGAQRVKGVSIKEVLKHALKAGGKGKGEIGQKEVETSLIDSFLYPKLGAGQMWNEVASEVRRLGGEIHLGHRVAGIKMEDGLIRSATVVNEKSGVKSIYHGEYFISTMPVRELIGAMGNEAPQDVRSIADRLSYRDFISVGILLDSLSMETKKDKLNDNWIYIQEKDVKLGRIQLFHNWSPYMCTDPTKKWLGLEYFCNEGDSFWNMPDDEIASFAIDELLQMEFASKENVNGSFVVRMKKAYPSYTGAYLQFETVQAFTDKIDNLFLIGRNGMHRYNNMDHSMLSAMTAVENIKNGKKSKDNIWKINAEQTYHEEKKQ